MKSIKAVKTNQISEQFSELHCRGTTYAEESTKDIKANPHRISGLEEEVSL